MAEPFEPAADHDAAESDLPLRIGSYRRRERIASGGFGVVFRAEHAELGTPAALKVVHRELAASPLVVARFEREIEAIRRILHPGVVRVLENGRIPGGRPFLVMELLSGETLAEHLRGRGRLPIDEALAILEPLCAAVAAAHACSIVHRDIKASNVMLARDGDAMRVVLLDFGVAKLLDDEGPKLTASRHLVGTLSCMAPEQILNATVDERTDVYALGVLAYRMLTGEMPFAARSVLAMQQMHLGAVPRLPSALVPLKPACDAVLMRALAKPRDERQPSAAAFFESLRAATQSAEQPRPAERRVLAVLVEALVEPEALDAPTDRLLADMETILPRAAAELSRLGLEVAMEAGTTWMLVIERPLDPRADLRLRRSVLIAVLSLHDDLQARPGADPGVRPRFCVHSGPLALDATGTAVAGALLQLDTWLPPADVAGPLASRAAMEGLAPQGKALPGAGGDWHRLG